MHDAYRQRETALAAAMADRTDWERATRQQRQLPSPPTPNYAAATPASPGPRCAPPNPNPLETDADPQSTAQGPDLEAIARLIDETWPPGTANSPKLAERQSLMIPAEDPDYEDLGPAFPAWAPARPDAILQPPKPEIPPSERILEQTADRDPDREAAD